MKCLRCQHENEAGAKFCEECAAPLALACAKCGRPLSPTAKFCPECAYPTGLSTAPPPAHRFDSPESYTPKHLAEKILTSKSALEGERKQVTVLFADLKSSLELLADRDPEEARQLLDPVLQRMMETGLLVGAPGAYRLAQPLDTLHVPATVQAVLAARIDRLPPEEKRLLQTAAVIGTEVPMPLLQAIAALPEAAFHHGLAHLQAAEFLYETRLFPDQAY